MKSQFVYVCVFVCVKVVMNISHISHLTIIMSIIDCVTLMVQSALAPQITIYPTNQHKSAGCQPISLHLAPHYHSRNCPNVRIYLVVWHMLVYNYGLSPHRNRTDRSVHCEHL